MKKTALTVFAISVITLIAHAQFKPGYIITHENDTIQGLIADLGARENAHLCKFQLDENAEISSYSPEQLKGYRFTGSKYFTSQQVSYQDKNEQVFLEFIIDGEVDIFSLKTYDNTIYFYRKQDGDIIWLDGEEKYVTAGKTAVDEIMVQNNFTNQSSTYLAPKKFIGLLKVAFSDVPSVSNRVTSASLTKNSLIKLSKQYHNAICDSYECIVYEKENGQKALNFGLLAEIGTAQYTRTNVTPLGHLYLQHMDRINVKPEFYLGGYATQNIESSSGRAAMIYGLTLGHRNLEYTDKETLSGTTYRSRSLQISSWNLNASVLYSRKLSSGKISPIIRLGLNANAALNTDMLFEDQTHYAASIVRNERQTDPASARLDLTAKIGTGISINRKENQDIQLSVDYLPDFMYLPGFFGHTFRASLYFPF